MRNKWCEFYRQSKGLSGVLQFVKTFNMQQDQSPAQNKNYLHYPVRRVHFRYGADPGIIEADYCLYESYEPAKFPHAIADAKDIHAFEAILTLLRLILQPHK